MADVWNILLCQAIFGIDAMGFFKLNIPSVMVCSPQFGRRYAHGD